MAAPSELPLQRMALWRWGRDVLRASSAATPDLDARVLLLDLLQLDHSGLILDPDAPVTAEQASRFAEMIGRRARGEPVSRILGYREFYGERLGISPATLDPRPDTEILVEATLAIVEAMGWRHGVAGRPLRLLDFGTGTGAIIIALLKALPGALGLAVDRSPEALAVARANARSLGVADRLAFVCGDWGEALQGRVDVIVSNPPYIESEAIADLAPDVRDFDPRLALDGGADGLDAYRAIVPQAIRLLDSQGWLVFEVGAGQADDVATLMAGAGFVPGQSVPVIHRDYGGHDRVVSMQLA